MSMSVCSNAECNCSLRIVYWRSLPMSWQISVDAVLRSVQKTAMPIAANICVAVAEAARQLSTDDLVVLLQQQGTSSVAWNRVRKSKMQVPVGWMVAMMDTPCQPALLRCGRRGPWSCCACGCWCCSRRPGVGPDKGKHADQCAVCRRGPWSSCACGCWCSSRRSG